MTLIAYTLDVPDELLVRIVTAMRAFYPEFVELDNPTAFRAVGSQFWSREVLCRYEASQAGAAAEAAIGDAYQIAYDQALADFAAIG